MRLSQLQVMIVVIIAASFMFGTAAQTKADPSEIIIGVCGAMSGPSQAYGQSMQRGAELAAEMITRRPDPFSNLPVRLIIVDDGNDETLTSQRVTSLIYDDECLALIGTTDSGCTHVAARLAFKSRVPLIATIATDPSLTRLGNPWVFRNLADDLVQGRRLVRHMVDTRRLRNLFIAHIDTRYGRGGAAVVGNAARDVGARTHSAPFSKGQEDFEPLITTIRNTNPEAIIIWGLYEEGARLLAALRRNNLHLPVFGPDGLASPAFIERAGNASEGVVVTYPFDDRAANNPLVAQFVTDYERRWGEKPDSFAAHAFDAVYLIAEAVRRGGPDRESIRNQLAQMRDFWGVTGILAFDSEGNINLPVHLATVREGRFVLLERE